MSILLNVKRNDMHLLFNYDNKYVYSDFVYMSLIKYIYFAFMVAYRFFFNLGTKFVSNQSDPYKLIFFRVVLMLL